MYSTYTFVSVSRFLYFKCERKKTDYMRASPFIAMPSNLSPTLFERSVTAVDSLSYLQFVCGISMVLILVISRWKKNIMLW